MAVDVVITIQKCYYSLTANILVVITNTSS